MIDDKEMVRSIGRLKESIYDLVKEVDKRILCTPSKSPCKFCGLTRGDHSIFCIWMEIIINKTAREVYPID